MPDGPGEGAGDVADPAGDWLGRLLHQFVRATGMLHPDRAVLGEHLSISEGMALAELSRDAPLTQQDLGARLGLEKSTVSRLVAGMQRRGLVERSRHHHNRRFAHVHITEHGRRLLHRMTRAMAEHHRHVIAAMTPAEREALTVGMTALIRAMDEVHTAHGAHHGRGGNGPRRRR